MQLSRAERKVQKELKRLKQRKVNILRARQMRANRLEEPPNNKKPEAVFSKVLVGCSGWFYWHWKDRFYPASLKTSGWFNHYKKSFNTVELNAPFYNWPTKAIVKAWLKNVNNREFIYTVKVSELITHIKKFKSTKTLILDFNYIADLLRGHMGCFLYQLPPSYKYTKARLENIVKQLDNKKRNVVEFRHISWWNETVYKAFRKHRIIFCSVSSPTMPDELIKTHDEVYIRFHGTKKIYSHDYSPKEMSVWLERIKQSGAKRVWAYFNNDRDANAIKNAKWFKKHLII